MKKLFLMISVVTLFTGCTMLKENKLTLCIGTEAGNCPANFKEIDGSIVSEIPITGAGMAGDIANSVLTCVNYGHDENLTCPDGTIKLNIDIIK